MPLLVALGGVIMATLITLYCLKRHQKCWWNVDEEVKKVKRNMELQVRQERERRERVEEEKEDTLDRLEAMELKKKKLEKENKDILEDFEEKVLARAKKTNWKPQ